MATCERTQGIKKKVIDVLCVPFNTFTVAAVLWGPWVKPWSESTLVTDVNAAFKAQTSTHTCAHMLPN